MPPMLTSAFAGVEVKVISTRPPTMGALGAGATVGVKVGGDVVTGTAWGKDATTICAGAPPTNLVRSSLISPFTYAVISVPFGIVTSLPCMKRKKGAAGKKT